MAFTNNQLSSQPLPAAWETGGEPTQLSKQRDTEIGPIAEQDPSHGHLYQLWTSYISDDGVYLQAEHVPPKKLLDNPEETITDFSFCFNQNADLHYVWVDDGVAYFRYFETLTAGMEVMTLPEGTTSPKLTLDDKRAAQSSISDVILCYVDKYHRLVMRLQRERFLQEHILNEGPFLCIRKMYMNKGLRLQWEMTWWEEDLYGQPVDPNAGNTYVHPYGISAVMYGSISYLRWTNPSIGHTKQYVYRTELETHSGPITEEPLAILTPETFTFNDEAVEAGKTYYYRIATVVLDDEDNLVVKLLSLPTEVNT